jgi:hypothetical protein
LNNPLPQTDSSGFFIGILDLLEKVLDFVYDVVGYAAQLVFEH